MIETTKAEVTAEAEIATEKAYEFRRLQSKDIFLMTKIISKIGLSEFAALYQKGSAKDAISALISKKASEKAKEDKEDNDFISIGVSIAAELAEVVLTNMNKCENEIYLLLSNVSNLSVKEVETLDAVIFLEMIIEFVQKEEFKDFFKVVSRLSK
jgi:hypothetical protein